VFNHKRYILLAVLCLASTLSLAQRSGPVAFNLPDHGRLLLAVPAAWDVEIRPVQGRAPPTLHLSPRNGKTFHVMLTPMWTADAATPFPDDESVRAKVSAAATEAQLQSVEQTLTVLELSGKADHGYYFTVTDRDPKPEEWKYLTQGIIRIGPVDLAFSVLTNDGQDSVIKSALAMLGGAIHES